MFTPTQYDKVLRDIMDARKQDVGGYCTICEDSDHTAETCGWNPLVALAICRHVAREAHELHDLFHCYGDENTTPEISGEFIQRMHRFLHYLAGFDQHVGEQVGPAKVIPPSDEPEDDRMLTLAEMTEAHILWVFAKSQHDYETAADALGISMSALHRYLFRCDPKLIYKVGNPKSVIEKAANEPPSSFVFVKPNVGTEDGKWYHDGVENGVDLWRMDVSVEGNDFQLQLSATEAGDQFKPMQYVKPHLYIERDNRARDDNFTRVDYAFADWDITAEFAIELLASHNYRVIELTIDKLQHVAGLPNVAERFQ